MKLLLSLVIAILAAVVLAQRPSTTLEPMDWSTGAFLMTSDSTIQVITKKDLLITFDPNGLSPLKRGTPPIIISPVMSIRRRNAEGVYEPVGNFTEVASLFASTNGKWVAVFSEGTVMFSVDSKNVISESSYLPYNSNGGYMLSDDTFVGYDNNSPTGDGNYTIRTYQYEASNNTWMNIPAAELIVTTGVLFAGDFASYRVSDTHLVIIDVTNISNTNVQIYSRQVDKSWTFVESIPVNNSFIFAEKDASVNYNGMDTLILSTKESNGNSTGFMFVYTKSNGQWTEQTFTTESVGYRPQGGFGAVTTFIDANTLLVTAELDGYNGNGMPNNIGKVLVMTRNNNGMWEPSLDLNNPTGTGVWGSGVGVNDYDIIIPNVVFPIDNSAPTLTFYTAPRCFMQPINVTCNDQQVNDCSQLDISSLYTINNAQCGAVSATVNSISLVDNKAIQARFSFTRHFGQTVSCNSTVTCPVPPAVVVVQQPSTPSKVSSAVVLVQSGLVSLLLGFIVVLA